VALAGKIRTGLSDMGLSRLGSFTRNAVGSRRAIVYPYGVFCVAAAGDVTGAVAFRRNLGKRVRQFLGTRRQTEEEFAAMPRPSVDGMRAAGREVSRRF